MLGVMAGPQGKGTILAMLNSVYETKGGSDGHGRSDPDGTAGADEAVEDPGGEGSDDSSGT